MPSQPGTVPKVYYCTQELHIVIVVVLGFILWIKAEQGHRLLLLLLSSGCVYPDLRLCSLPFSSVVTYIVGRM